MKTVLWGIVRREMFGPAVVAAVALLSVILTLDAAGDYPALGEGPGVTLDESFNVQMGVYQWKVFSQYNLAVLHPDSVRELFGPQSNYNPDHPPLGRLWLGFWHDLIEWLFPPENHPLNEHGVRFVTDCARVGSATAFALTVFLIGWTATLWYGRLPGLIAATSLVLMPRVFAHAHIASLETFMNLAYSGSVLAVAHWWLVPRSGLKQSVSESNERRLASVSWQTAVLTGIVFGLALLSKIQAILIPPVVGIWALWHWRQRAIKPLVIFGITGLVVFIMGWPWLWLDPLTNLREYFARTTARAVLHCYYLGQVWADKDVPWHYPFVMFAVTVPIGLQALGIVGVTRLKLQTREHLLVLATALPLVLFALPGVAVYDGERLFLVSYPIWAVLIGRGAMIAVQLTNPKRERGHTLQNTPKSPSSEATALAHASGWCEDSSSPATVRQWTVLGIFLVSQSIGVIAMHPCQLSYYNLLIGGLSGAERLGFERTYWGDSITRSTMRELAELVDPDSVVAIEPVLHQFQLRDLEEQSPILRERRIRFVTSAELQEAESRGRPLKVWGSLGFARKADIQHPESKEWRVLPERKVLPGEARQGVTLSIAIELSH